MNDASLGLVSMTPVLIQLWTNGRPVSTGTIVPFRAASLRLLALLNSQDENGNPVVMRFRAEVCPFTGASNVSTEAVEGETLEAVTRLMSLGRHVEPVSHLFWKEETITNPATHWAQNVCGDACKIAPVIGRKSGDGVLAQVLRLAGLAEPALAYVPDRDEVEDFFVSLGPPVMGEDLVANTGLVFFAGHACEVGSIEFELLQASGCKETKETVPPLVDAAWA